MRRFEGIGHDAQAIHVAVFLHLRILVWSYFDARFLAGESLHFKLKAHIQILVYGVQVPALIVLLNRLDPVAEPAVVCNGCCNHREHFLLIAGLIHYYRVERPGQSRGIPEITPAIPLFAQLRRYTLAVIAAAETAADFAAVLYTDAPANGEADAVEPMDLVELERRMDERGIRMPADKNPVRKVGRYKERAPEIRFLTLAQIDEQLDALAGHPQIQTMVAMYIYAGLRREELLWLIALCGNSSEARF